MILMKRPSVYFIYLLVRGYLAVYLVYLTCTPATGKYIHNYIPTSSIPKKKIMFLQL